MPIQLESSGDDVDVAGRLRRLLGLNGSPQEMARWRYGLIAAYVGCGLVGGWVATYRQAFIGVAVFSVGCVCMFIHLAIERREKKVEEAARAVWVAEVQRAADDVGLEDYGVTSLQELARYHDAAGRAAVLAALRSLPAGQRSLLVAARDVEPDAAWD